MKKQTIKKYANINLEALAKVPGIDAVDALLFAWCKDFVTGMSLPHNIKKATKKIHDEAYFFWFDYNYIARQMPILKITTSDAIQRRLKKLCTVTLLEGHPDNWKKGKSYYTLGPLFETIVYTSAADYGEDLRGPRTEEKEDKPDLRGPRTEEKPISAAHGPSYVYNKEDSMIYIIVREGQKGAFSPPLTDDQGILLKNCIYLKFRSLMEKDSFVVGPKFWAAREAEKLFVCFASKKWKTGRNKIQDINALITNWYARGVDSGTYLRTCSLDKANYGKSKYEKDATPSAVGFKLSEI